MTTLRVANATILADHRLRVANVVVSGTGTAPKLRVASATISGTITPSLQPFADQLVEALATVTLTAVVGATSPIPDRFSWRQVSGPATDFADLGGTITFVAPAAGQGTTVVFGVTAILGTQSSLEATASVAVLPHLYWLAGSSGWEPLTRALIA